MTTKFFILWIVFCYEPFVYKASFDHYKLLIRYSQFHNLLINMQICWRHKFCRFRKSLDDKPYFGEPLLVPIYTSLKADISGTRKDIKKKSTVFFLVFPVLSFHILFKTFLNGLGKPEEMIIDRLNLPGALLILIYDKWLLNRSVAFVQLPDSFLIEIIRLIGLWLVVIFVWRRWKSVSYSGRRSRGRNTAVCVRKLWYRVWELDWNVDI